MTASIIIRAFNAGETITRTIQSALAQEFPRDEYEILVIDDGSKDDTSEVVKSFQDPRIRIVSQENKGIAEAGNTGLREAKGDIVVFLDADDESMPDALAFAQKAIRGDVAYAYGDYFEEYQGVRKRIESSDPFKAPIGAFAWKKDLLLALGGFSKDTIFPEYDVILRQWGSWKSTRINEPMFVYHRSKASITGDSALVLQALEDLRAKYPKRQGEIGQIRSYMLS